MVSPNDVAGTQQWQGREKLTVPCIRILHRMHTSISHKKMKVGVCCSGHAVDYGGSQTVQSPKQAQYMSIQAQRDALA